MSRPSARPRYPHSQRLAWVTAFCCCLWSSPASAQPAAKPAQSGIPSTPESASPAGPQVRQDGTVIFRLAMPNAAKVELNLEGAAEPLPMTKGSDGVWSATVSKLAPQYYGYTFGVDGTDVLDPHNVNFKTSFFGAQNFFLVRSATQALGVGKRSPGGGASSLLPIQHCRHKQRVLRLHPPNFDPGSKQLYPVLFLLHGGGSDPSGWTVMGKADVILDNLISQGRARPMMIVMPLGFGTMDVINRDGGWDDPELVHRNFTRFSDALFQEVMPLLKQQYPVSEKREDHAVAGLSMGGTESLLIGLNHLDDFAYIGGFSSGPLEQSGYASSFPGITAQSSPAINARLRLLWIACGTEDELFGSNQKFIAWLKEKGLQPTAIQTPGLHAWMVWRDNLTNFAPLLFQSK